MKIFTRLTTVLFLFASVALAQNEAAPFQVPTTNSGTTIQQRIAATDIEISYNRPNVKGRKIFGELVPYGKIWRTGSDAATKISFSTPLTLNGTPIDAGSYEIFSIPGEQEWTVIIHKNQSQWGSYSYDAAK